MISVKERLPREDWVGRGAAENSHEGAYVELVS